MSSTSHSKRIYASQKFQQQAHIPSENNADIFRDSAERNPEAFWSQLALALKWEKPFEKVHSWNPPHAKWFEGGELNLSVNCLDRHRSKKKNAIVWEGEPTDSNEQPLELRQLSYEELLKITCQIANTLKDCGVQQGDRVAIYMPMVPETVAAMQACARIGAVHTVIFAGFSASSIRDRINDSQAKVLITADGLYRKGAFLNLKAIVDEALKEGAPSIKKVLVYQRKTTEKPSLVSGRDLLWSESVAKAQSSCAPIALKSEDPLFILYTSGTTGKPKGLYHTQAGYLLWTHWTSRWLFDLKESDLFWCTADCGWITGHSYLAYGPLSNGATIMMYEGAPLTPSPSRFWQIIERHKVSVLYTAPTAIRNFMRFGDDAVIRHNLSSLRLLGSVGEPINPEAWRWYYEVVGHEECPVVDTWWQTETGGAMIAPFPGATPLVPGSATKALPGVSAEVWNPETAKRCEPGERGALVITKPWPSMARGIWGDEGRYKKTYWENRPGFEGVYFTGDFAIQDEQDYFWIEGRMDDVLNVSGHRIGSAEVESALVEHPDVVEAAVVGIPHEVKGQAIAAFVTLSLEAAKSIEGNSEAVKRFKESAAQVVAKSIGAHAKPDVIRLAKALPKTRSGKIMRRLLKELATNGKITGDTTTLEDFSAETSIE